MKGRYIAIALVVLSILIISIAVVSAGDVDVVRDFDNTTVYHAVKSDSSSQAVYGLENNAKLIGRDKINHIEPVSKMANTEIKVDDGYYTYTNLVDENGIQLNPTDKVKFNYNRTLTAVYKFTPYMFAEIDVIDLHGHSSSEATYPAMKTASDSITKTFKEYTDVEEGYRPLYILDIDTNTKYQPGDKFTITYQDVVNTGMTKIIKTFQYVYAKDIVIENIIIENKTIKNITYVNKTIENITYVNKTIEVPIYVNKTIEIPKYITKIIEIPIYVTKIIEKTEIENKTVIKNETKKVEDITEEIKNVTEKEKIKNVPETIPTKEVINKPVKKVVNNTGVIQNNENKTIKVSNNNTTKTNTTTTNTNDENNTSTPTSNNIKTIKMKETGNPIGWLVLFFFIIALAAFAIRDKE